MWLSLKNETPHIGERVLVALEYGSMVMEYHGNAVWRVPGDSYDIHDKSIVHWARITPPDETYQWNSLPN